MQYILSDHNCEGQAEAIFDALRHQGFFPLLPITLVQFLDVGLDFSANDREVWQFCQENGYLLLTGNRTASDGEKSLEYAIRHFLKEDSLPRLARSTLSRKAGGRSVPLWCPAPWPTPSVARSPSKPARAVR